MIAQIDNPRQRLANGHPNEIHQRHRRSTSAALAAVERDEIGRAIRPTFRDQLKELFPRLGCANHGLEPRRFAGDLADVTDHVEQIVEIMHLKMTVWRDTGLPGLNATDLGNLGRDLVAGQDAALAGFRPLRQLQLEHLDHRVLADLPQLLVIEPAIAVPHAILGRADLKDDVAAAFEVIG